MFHSLLIPFTLSFLSGLFLGELYEYFPLLLTALLLFLIFIERFLKRWISLSPSIWISAALGFILYQWAMVTISPSDLRIYTGLPDPIQVVAQIDGPIQRRSSVEKGKEQIILSMKGRAIGADHRPLHGRFTLIVPVLTQVETFSFEYGDRVEMYIRLRQPQQFQNSGVFQSGDYQERQGISGRAYLLHLTDIKKVGSGGNPILKKFYRWRKEIDQQMRTELFGAPLALYLALTIGESGALTDDIRERFSASGTTHILSISGSHLAFVSMIVFGVSRWLLLHLPMSLLLRLTLFQKIPSQWAAWVAAASVTFYAFLAGGEVATIRSLVMILIYLFSIWFNRAADLKVSLCLAALLILIPDPLGISSISFQLSFLSVLSIVLVMEWWKGSQGEEAFTSEGWVTQIQIYLIKPIRFLLLTSAAAMLGTAPLVLYYFHQFSWVGLFSNLIIIPFVGFIVVPLALGSAVASLWLHYFPFAIWHQRLGAFYDQMTFFFAAWPGADFHVASPSLPMIFLFYLVFFLMLIHKVAWKPLVASLIFFFVVFLGWGGPWGRLPPDHVQVTFLDVGQGDAAFLEFSNGKTMLIDGGGSLYLQTGKVAIAPYLWERKIKTIDYLVGTHPQMDHMGGLTYLIQKFNIGEVWTNGVTQDKMFYRLFDKALQEKKVSRKVITTDVALERIGECGVTVLNPTSDQLNVSSKQLNNDSLVLRMICHVLEEAGAAVSFLFTGDIEKKAEEKIVQSGGPLRSTFLKVPHHGSKNASSDLFLSAVSPAVSVVSVGARNPYHHPHPDTLSRLNQSGTTVFRTDREGAVTVHLQTKIVGTPFWIELNRETALKKIKWDQPLGQQEWRNIWGVRFSNNVPPSGWYPP